MAFPVSPTTGQQYTTPGGVLYEYKAYGAWAKVVPAAVVVPTAATLQEVIDGVVSDKYISPATFPTLKFNLTLNVPADYPTIADALTYLDDFRIPGNVVATIQVAAGVHVGPAGYAGHPDGNQIAIVGAPLIGVFPTASSFSMSRTSPNPQNIGSLTTDRGTTLTMLQSKYATHIDYTATSSVCHNFESARSIGQWTNLLVYGNAAIANDFVNVRYGSSTRFTNCSIHAFLQGINAFRGGSVESSSLTVSGCKGTGIVSASQSNIAMTGACIVFGCEGSGFYIGNSGWINASSCDIKGNLSIGIECSDGSVATVPNAVVTRNGGDGIFCSTHAYVDCKSATSNNSGGFDFHATHGGFIWAQSSNTGSGTYSPTVNTVGNQFATIDT